jgi:transcriptional regulator with XRE-family HTH domain
MRILLRPSNNLRYYRKKAKLQQEEVAEILGLKYTSLISRWEKSFSYPDLINALKLAITYGVTVDDLYSGLRESITEDII